jgi:hypothetical protein
MHCELRGPETMRDCEPFTEATILAMVIDGHMSVRRAARELDWTMDDVQIAIWGEVRL